MAIFFCYSSVGWRDDRIKGQKHSLSSTAQLASSKSHQTYGLKNFKTTVGETCNTQSETCMCWHRIFLLLTTSSKMSAGYRCLSSASQASLTRSQFSRNERKPGRSVEDVALICLTFARSSRILMLASIVLSLSRSENVL